MCYGLADITINADYSVTLNAFAYENVRGAAITTSLAAPVREPSTLAFMSLRLAGVSAAARRRKKGLGALRRGPDAGPHWQSLGRAYPVGSQALRVRRIQPSSEAVSGGRGRDPGS
jgi:hypothetical protein